MVELVGIFSMFVCFIVFAGRHDGNLCRSGF